MPHFPMFIDLKDRTVLILGGGKVAARKLEKLAPYGARAVVVAPEILPQIARQPGVTLRQRRFRRMDLYPRPALVIAATNDREVNAAAARLCRRRNIPINVADEAQLCTFLFPAAVQRGSFSAGFCTGGASPTAAAWFREQLELQLPEQLEQILDWLEQQRGEVKKKKSDPAQRADILRRMFYGCLDKGAPLSPAEAASCFTAQTGSVTLVGAGCGKADLITLRGLRELHQCQAVVYDELIDPALLDAAPESARRIYMGKRSGHHSAPQEQISQTLIDLAREGLRVVRLKGGDPYLFGRGGEEMLALKAAGIPCREVPGITSAIGIPAEAGIPVTHRGMSRSLHIVTAHTADTADGLPGGLEALAGIDGTLVFLMGLGQLPALARRLMEAGKSGDTPAAVISGGNAPNPAQIRAPLKDIAQAAREAGITAPAIILVGRTAELDLR